MSWRGVGGQYDPPSNYGIPNPLGPRVHNWKGGPLNEGSLYHGPVYTRPTYNLPWAVRPLFGVGQEERDLLPCEATGFKLPCKPSETPGRVESAFGAILPVIVMGSVLIILSWPTERKK